MKYCVILCILCIFFYQTASEEDLYNVLGVRKSASNKEIKNAYKKLARQWHPDKNREEGANEKFMTINEAYETLSDPDKRAEYDQFGRTSSQGSPQQHRGGGHMDPFEAFFSGFGGGGRFNFGGDRGGDKRRITIRSYNSKVIPESHEKPYLLYIYSDFCFACMQAESVWDRVVRDLETIGMGMGTVHANMDGQVAHKLRINNVPALVAIVGGKVRHYSGQFHVNRIRDFIRGVFPSDLVTKVTDKNYQEFLHGWHDNKVRTLYFAERPDATLRFVLAAHAYRHRVKAGYVQLSSMSSFDLQSEYNIMDGRETMLMFNEDTTNPIATMTMKQLPRSTIDEIMESNKYLSLPRLSSQVVFNDLCPPSSNIQRKKLCVVLLSKDIPQHEPHRSSFRKFAQDHSDPEERVRFAYLYQDTQESFVHDITRGQGINNDTALKVAVIWRRDKDRVQLAWLDEGWPADPSNVGGPGRQLFKLLDGYKHGSQMLPYTILGLHDLEDEHKQALLDRIMQRLADWADAAYEKLRNMDEMTVMTLTMTIALVLFLGVMMKFVLSDSMDQVPRQRMPQATRPPQPPRKPVLNMHELTSETFALLVTEVPAGVRTIVLLVDEEAKQKLVQKFAAVAINYSQGLAFKFCFLQLEKQLKWYKDLLEETLGNNRSIDGIKTKNCIGTVLSLNGPRKYYCIYHPKQPMTGKSGEHKKRQNAGEFMGFDDSESDTEIEAQMLFESDVLCGLGVWMERLCDGELRRFKLDVWPSMDLE